MDTKEDKADRSTLSYDDLWDRVYIPHDHGGFFYYPDPDTQRCLMCGEVVKIFSIRRS